ncbi:response regulator receiver sensor signal transduction histidine kinase [Phreatobacter oligotrophus]|uniref:histidine kinase n=2 Tax=Phreatobacter oligotrophus TaxID=1122261 RepID=A0A2T4ZGJ6_9HYPH|nr:ATP-binding protein [Phreatobacter oligotrophus]PTM61049.1 response regulator receiver sensor signal transduction histidine kinase [Phreatobacter oligotrophus]
MTSENDAETRMTPEDDDLVAIFEDGPVADVAVAGRWKVAIIDDDPAVHSGTKYALSDYQLAGHRLDLHSAFSAAEGRSLLARHPDMAVVLLDVVMESDGAGLDLVEYIRKELGNDTVRIILRTGQPGQAPERQVIVDYDINDYKAKTELTGDKLFTSLTAALRSHQQLIRLTEMRRGLEAIVGASARIYGLPGSERLAAAVLAEAAALVGQCGEGAVVMREAGATRVLAARNAMGELSGRVLPGRVDDLVARTFAAGASLAGGHDVGVMLHTAGGRDVVVALVCEEPPTETQAALLGVFCGSLPAAFDTVLLYEQLQAANATLEKRVADRTRQLTAANERLKAQWQRLKRTNDHKAEVLGTVAHDLKNPLGVILGRSEMMNELLALSPPNIDRARGQIEQIRSSVARMTSMVDELLADAMLDAEDVQLRFADIDTAAIVGAVLDANVPLADRKGQLLLYHGPDSLTGRGDPDRLREAIDNLVSNAVKYSPPGGRITVTLSGSEAGHSIAVTDSGPGLTPEDQQRLFGRFQRLSATPTGGESSTGLGLFICRRIVELHGGRITAANAAPGRGATFTIVLPPATAGGPS